MLNFTVGTKVRVTSVDEYDIARGIEFGMIGTVVQINSDFDDVVRVEFKDDNVDEEFGDTLALLTNQLEIVYD